MQAEPEIRGLAVRAKDRLFFDENLPIGPLNNLRLRGRPRDRLQSCLSLAAFAFTLGAQVRKRLRLPARLHAWVSR